MCESMGAFCVGNVDVKKSRQIYWQSNQCEKDKNIWPNQREMSKCCVCVFFFRIPSFHCFLVFRFGGVFDSSFFSPRWFYLCVYYIRWKFDSEVDRLKEISIDQIVRWFFFQFLLCECRCVCACCGRRFGHFIWWMCGASATVYSFSFDDCLIAIASRSRPRFFFLFSFRCVLDNVQAHELVHHVFCSSLCFVCVACVRRTCCSWADAETNITWSISTCAIFSASLAFERTLALDKKKTPKKKKDKKVAAALAWDYFYYI